MKSTLFLAFLVLALSFLAGCKAPDEAVGDASKKDSTAKEMKKGGGSDE